MKTNTAAVAAVFVKRKAGSPHRNLKEMIEVDKPFWERTYRDAGVTTFGVKPNRAVEALYETFEKDWAILEVGCGEGKNSIFLAEQGFKNLDAFDLSEAGIEKLRKLAEEKGLSVNAWAEDLTKYAFPKDYDVIISYGTLHFVTKEEWKQFVTRAKAHTNPGGLNIFQMFTNKVPASEDIAPFAKGLAEEGELLALYSDWEVVLSDAHVFEDEHPGVKKHFHASNTVAARKPR
jgi:cyclopropane fatty-acyl-phospholipid synthase-like methyltransferase